MRLITSQFMAKYDNTKDQRISQTRRTATHDAPESFLFLFVPTEFELFWRLYWTVLSFNWLIATISSTKYLTSITLSCHLESFNMPVSADEEMCGFVLVCSDWNWAPLETLGLDGAVLSLIFFNGSLRMIFSFALVY